MTMARLRARTGTRIAVALAVAYAIALQALLSSFAGALHAAAAPDGLGLHVICTPDGAAPPPASSDGPGRPGHHALCCILGCGQIGGAAMPGPAVVTPSGPVAGDQGQPRPADPSRVLGRRLHVGSVGARAPPDVG